MNKYLSGSTALMSAVLVGFVLVSKLNAFGLSECGEAVVELANHSFESVAGFDIPVAFADVVEPLFDGFVPDNALFVPDILILSCALPAFVLLLPVADNVVVVLLPLVTLTWPNAIAIGLGDESGDDVNDDIYPID